MNERLKEFADQCYHRYSEHNINLAKFVNLIVQECMDICEQQRLKILDNPDDPSWTEHLAECQTIMQQRFLQD